MAALRRRYSAWGYRPVKHDRFDALVKYTYFYNVPTTDQVGQNGTSSQFIQKSHIAAIDLTYDLTDYLSIGGKYAYRLSQVSVDREDPDFFDNNAHLYILRTDLRILKHWETTVEGRLLDLTDLDERRAGALVTLYRYFGKHFKAGIGYNFTDFLGRSDGPELRPSWCVLQHDRYVLIADGHFDRGAVVFVAICELKAARRRLSSLVRFASSESPPAVRRPHGRNG